MSEHKSAEQRHAHTIYWDDPHIDAEMELFPKDIQPLYQWLKIWVRDECKRDVDVLVEHARRLGVTIDKTNWVRILKGRWRHDADGNELPNPYVSATNLLNAIKALKHEIRIELLQGGMPFFETTVFHTIRRFVEKKMRKDRVNRFGAIVGPTGLQKTASYKELALRCPDIKWLESADNGSIKELTIRFAVKCGASRSIAYGPARQKIFEAMEPHNGRIKCVIVDNMQDMVRTDKALKAMGKVIENQPAYGFLRSLQDESGCAVIWSITPDKEDSMFDRNSVYLEQFEGRFGGRDGLLRLPNNNPKADLLMIAEGLGLKDAGKHLELLQRLERERGRIRRYFELLQDAKDAADADGERLTASYLEEALAERALPEPRR